MPNLSPVRAPGDTREKQRLRGLRIRWAREIVEPSRLQFARKLGVDVSTIRDIETGKTNPGIELAWRLFHSIRISLDYVVAGRLIGVDPELVALLVAAHPELAPTRPPAARLGSPDTAPQPNTYANSDGSYPQL
jgi:transcriptional regulator with XRE-family HTH domain